MSTLLFSIALVVLIVGVTAFIMVLLCLDTNDERYLLTWCTTTMQYCSIDKPCGCGQNNRHRLMIVPRYVYDRLADTSWSLSARVTS